jgi:hypothetical protein
MKKLFRIVFFIYLCSNGILRFHYAPIRSPQRRKFNVGCGD